MTALSKAEYLQRYLSGNEDKKTKKKKKIKEKSQQRPSGLRIVEDDAFISVSANYKDVDTDEEKEDIEIISSISRQLEAKAREGPKFLKSFKPLDGGDIKVEVKTEVLSDDDGPSTSQANQKNESSGSRSLDDRRSANAQSQESRRRHASDEDQSPVRRRRDSDHSPVRKRHDSPARKHHDSDHSAIRRKRHDSDQSPARRKRHDSDHSPIRRKRHDSDQSPARRKRHDSDQSPVRRRHDSDDSDLSRARKRHDSRSPVRKRRDSDRSPSRNRHKGKESSSTRSKRRHDSDSDDSTSPKRNSRRIASPPRKQLHKSRNDSGSDQSPPRNHGKNSQKSIKVEVDSDQSPERRGDRRRSPSSDLSPPRKYQKSSSPVATRRRDSDESPPRRREQPRGRERRIASPEKLGKESQKTLDGKIAGLQSADALKKESEKIREQESKMFEEMDASISGRFAETTVREKQVRKKREKPEDKERKEREAKKQAELQEKYDLWNKGVAQKERREEQLEEMARVAAEPLARMADDVAMNRHLKDLIHEEDPMAKMLISKKREKAIDRGDLIYPTYQGEAPPNRFGIRPGYRWDGVDRSNGFEAALAQTKNRRNAQEKEYYRNLQLYE
ncbi:unnamed protein product [Cylicocyclus nassatus]|uniref:BUD13 homolog n=1 Tax=Cylicocyclus nassatus TaxID=53992 RepID=A0AA36DQR4_CYLNA|nr:unnamed protein product [Cylicocyclus nassatus]